jgi:hypothetical protein
MVHDSLTRNWSKWTSGGWHGYEGADISDNQKSQYFIAIDAAPRLREAIAAGTMPARMEGLVERLEEIGFIVGR